MYCKECGKELKPTDAFCIICGTPTGVNKSSTGNYEVTGNTVDQGVDTVSVMYQNSPGFNSNLDGISHTTNSGKNRSGKKFLIIGIAVLAIIGVAVALLLFNRISPQRKLIDEYFEAINDKNAKKIYDLSYTDELKEGLPTYEDNKEFFFTNVRLMGFSRGLYELDVFKFVTCITETYGPDNNLNLDNSKDRIIDSLDVSYDIIDITALEDFDLKSDLLGHEEMVDMDELESIVSRYNLDTGEQIKVDIEDAYVAQVKVSWEYNGNLYGMKKSWWQNKEFKDFVAKRDLEQYDTYDKAIKSMETINDKDKIYILVLYKCDGEWFIYNGDKLASLAAQYEKGKATLLLY